jgi:hypothetical protein
MVMVWLICVPTQSSKRDLAPGRIDAGVFDCFFWRHNTALVYALRCLDESDPLNKALAGALCQTRKVDKWVEANICELVLES